MPRISLFYGIAIYMYWDEHPPPHFHAEYGGDVVLVNIQSLEIIRGRFPAKQRRMVLRWASAHQGELLENWSRAQHHEHPHSIEPLTR